MRDDKWRILVGDDAQQLDEAVRADPVNAYGPDGLSLASITAPPAHPAEKAVS